MLVMPFKGCYDSIRYPNYLQSNVYCKLVMIMSGPVHTTPEKFENAASFSIRLVLPFTLVHISPH